jgi:hypothetical protein
LESKTLGIVFLLFSLAMFFFVIPNFVKDSGQSLGMGPDTIPIVATIIIFLSSIGIILKGKANFTGEKAPSSFIWGNFAKKLFPFLVIVVGGILFSILISSIGLAVAVIVAVSLIYFAYGERKILQYIIGSGIVLIFGLAMKYGLDLYLPIWGK